MKIYQMLYNPTSDRLEAGNHTLHAQDEILVMIPDVKAQYRFLTISEKLVVDELCNRGSRPFRRVNLLDSTEYIERTWNSLWTSTRIQYDHSKKCWYLEGFPSVEPSGLFIQLVQY